MRKVDGPLNRRLRRFKRDGRKMIQFLSVLSAESAVVVSHKKSVPSCYVVAFAKTDDQAACRFRAERNRPPSRRSCLQRSMRDFAVVACNRISNCRLRLLLQSMVIAIKL